MARHSVWLDSDGHQTVYSLIRVFVISIQGSLDKSLARRQTEQLNRDSGWDSKCIDQQVYMGMLIKVFTFRRCIIADTGSL